MKRVTLLLTLNASLAFVGFVSNRQWLKVGSAPRRSLVTAVLAGVLLTLSVLIYLSGTRFSRRIEVQSHLYFDHDAHWTPAGQRIMAEGLSCYIAEHQLRRWCASK